MTTLQNYLQDACCWRLSHDFKVYAVNVTALQSYLYDACQGVCNVTTLQSYLQDACQGACSECDHITELFTGCLLLEA